MDIVAPKLLDMNMLLKTSCCHGHCNGCSSSDWLLRWITNARRASLALLMLSGIIIYCIPQARKPAKKGCHLLIDLVASSLKIIIGKIDDSEQVKIVEGSSENPKLFMSHVDSPEQTEIISGSLGNLENSTSSPLYPIVEDIPKNEILKDSKRLNVRFTVSENKRKRHKKQYLQNESDWLEHRKAFCEIHKPRGMKFKEKSVEKVSACPLPLMQFDTFEHHKLNSDSGLSDHRFHERQRKNLGSNECQNRFELYPLHFTNSDSNSYSDLSYFEIDSLNEDVFDDMLIQEPFIRPPESNRIRTNKDVEQIKTIEFDENPNRPMTTMSWLSDQIHKFERSLMTLSSGINNDISKLKDIISDESQSTVKSTMIGTSSVNCRRETVINKSQNILTPEKCTHETVKKEQSKFSRILDWIFGEEKHSSQVKEKKILNIVKQKFL